MKLKNKANRGNTARKRIGKSFGYFKKNFLNLEISVFLSFNIGGPFVAALAADVKKIHFCVFVSRVGLEKY